jgi:hypothetical protein
MTYALNTDWANQSVADRTCRGAGGVLVTYFSVREQVRGDTRPSADRGPCGAASVLLGRAWGALRRAWTTGFPGAR